MFFFAFFSPLAICKSKKKYICDEDVGIADQEKAGKQGRDESMELFSIQPCPTYLATLKM